jgi:DNA-binding GntR family transcriptional regulator
MRNAILKGELPEGTRLSEEELAASLGVSRSPVREALKQLAREGLVVSQRNRSSYVRVFGAKDIEEIFLIRAALESLGMEYALAHLKPEDLEFLDFCITKANDSIEKGDLEDLAEWDRKFHEYIMRKADLPQVFSMWQSILAQSWALLGKRFRSYPEEVHETVVTDHSEILEALRSRDATRIHQLNREINRRVADDLKRLVVN